MNILYFDFEGKRIRAFVKNGVPWFVGRDICKAINLASPSHAMKKLDEDEQFNASFIGNVKMTTAKRGLKFINESGLYSLIMASQKKEAKRFKKYAIYDLLPALRRASHLSAPGTEENGTASRKDDIAALVSHAVRGVFDEKIPEIQKIFRDRREKNERHIHKKTETAIRKTLKAEMAYENLKENVRKALKKGLPSHETHGLKGGNFFTRKMLADALEGSLTPSLSNKLGRILKEIGYCRVRKWNKSHTRQIRGWEGVTPHNDTGPAHPQA